VVIIAHFILGIVVYAYMKRVDEGQNFITTDDIWLDVKKYLGSIAINSIISYFIIAFALVLLFIPGIYVAIVVSLFTPIIIFEGGSFSDIWQRSFVLIKDKWWSTFGLLIIVSFIVSIMAYVFVLPSGIYTFLSMLQIVKSDSNIVMVVLSAIAMLGNTLLHSITYIALGFQYFNLVERADGTSIYEKVDTIGQSSQQDKVEEEGDF
jgi:hypothetical protein